MADALVIIDFQNDFCPGGALAVEGGDEIAAPIRRLAPHFDTVVATRDWHPPDHSSFADQGGPWPVHCVRETEGAQLHPSLGDLEVHAVVDKGQGRDEQGYSAFEQPELAELLRERGADRLVMTGLTTDYCVRASAIDAAREGFDVTLVEDAVRAVNAEPGDGDRAVEDMRAAGIRVATADEVLGAT